MPGLYQSNQPFYLDPEEDILDSPFNPLSPRKPVSAAPLEHAPGQSTLGGIASGISAGAKAIGGAVTGVVGAVGGTLADTNKPSGLLENTFGNVAFRKSLGELGAAMSAPGSKEQAIGLTSANIESRRAYSEVAKQLSQGVALEDIKELSALEPPQVENAMKLREQLETSKYSRQDTFMKGYNELVKAHEKGDLSDELYTRLVSDRVAAYGAEGVKAGAAATQAEKLETPAERSAREVNVANIRGEASITVGRERNKMYTDTSQADRAAAKERLQMQLDAQGLGATSEAKAKELDASYDAYDNIKKDALQVLKNKYPSGIIVNPVTGALQVIGMAGEDINNEYNQELLYRLQQRENAGLLMLGFTSQIAREIYGSGIPLDMLDRSGKFKRPIEMPMLNIDKQGRITKPGGKTATGEFVVDYEGKPVTQDFQLKK